MSYYEQKLNKALDYLYKPSLLTPTGHKPIAYFVYKPKDALLVSQMAQNYIKSRAEFIGFKPVFVSMGKLLNDFISNNTEYISLWNSVNASQENLLHKSIRQAIEKTKFFENEILHIQEEHIAEPKTLFILHDVEMMHPYYLMNNIETNIYNNIKLPILVLYPGDAQGTARSFLSIYGQDGNYRSLNF